MPFDFLRLLFFMVPGVGGISAVDDFDDLLLLEHIRQRPLHGDFAYVGAFDQYFVLGDFAGGNFYDFMDSVRLGMPVCQQTDTEGKLSVCGDDDSEEVAHERGVTIFSLMLIVGTCLQRFIIGFLGVGNHFLDEDIFPDDIPGTVQKKESQQTAHPAVSVIEGVNTEKFKYKDGNQK